MKAEEKSYFGISNPSGAVALNRNQFIVADDEDNRLRIYNKDLLENPIQVIELSQIFKNQIEDGQDKEIDLESAAEIQGNYFWIGSHSTSKKGEFRSARHALFAISLHPSGKGEFKVAPEGNVYTNLIDDLCDDSRFDRYQFRQAKNIQPKQIGGLNIEGLAATPEHTLILGFRNPLIGGKIKQSRQIKGKALIVELLNPFEVIHGVKGRFGDPVELDLDGFGIREITWRKKQKYMIIAGPYHDNLPTEDWPQEVFQIYQWSMKSKKLDKLDKLDLTGFNAEALFFYPEDDDTIQLLSDDGKLGNDGAFRSRTINFGSK
jgi:hypothetical protein